MFLTGVQMRKVFDPSFPGLNKGPDATCFCKQRIFELSSQQYFTAVVKILHNLLALINSK